MSDAPEPAATSVTVKNTAASTSEDILTGEHTVSESIIRLNREWRPKEASAQRFKDNVISLLEGMVNNTNTTVPDQGEEEPDPPPGGGGSPEMFYDSGYVYFEVATALGWANVPFNHNLGQVPTRFTLFYSNKAKPVVGSDDIVVIFPALRRNKYVETYNYDLKIGSRLVVDGKNSVTLKIAPNGIDGFFGATDNIIPADDGTKRPGYIRLMAWR
jgi:hypothetical protein